MKKKYFIIVIFALFSFKGVCAGEYSVSNIPDSLLENATAVIREHHIEMEFSSEKRAMEKVKKVITILERRREGLADIVIHHSPYVKVKKYSAIIYDAEGNVVRKLKKDDFTDRSNVPGFALYAENRVLYTDIYMSQFPFTVEFNYELDHREIMISDLWVPLPYTGVAVQESSYSIIVPSDMTFRYKPYNEPVLEPEISAESRGKQKYKWSILAMQAVKSESYMPPLMHLMPYVRFGSDNFHYHGYSGNMSTWNDFGKWRSKLNIGRQELPTSTVNKIHDLVQGVNDPREKARIVYEYMQSRSRYVSISLGIGGLQPFSAETVDKTAYGDCKALSNYTQALLSEVGVKSYYTVIKSGNRDFQPDPDFPSQNFNHAILCVPFDKDTLWVECTNSYLPFGHMSPSNEDRHVLVITEDGGFLTKTSKYPLEKNLKKRNVDVAIHQDGNIDIKASTNYQGNPYVYMLHFSTQAAETQRKDLIQSISLNSPDFTSIEVTNNKEGFPEITKKMELSAKQYISRAGNRILFQTNILSKLSSTPGLLNKRIHPIRLRESNMYVDSVYWEIPQGYSITHIPESVVIDNDFGYYSSYYEIIDNKLVYQRKYYTKDGLFDAERYDEFAEFFMTVYNNDRAQAVLQAE